MDTDTLTKELPADAEKAPVVPMMTMPPSLDEELVEPLNISRPADFPAADSASPEESTLGQLATDAATPTTEAQSRVLWRLLENLEERDLRKVSAELHRRAHATTPAGAGEEVFRDASMRAADKCASELQAASDGHEMIEAAVMHWLDSTATAFRYGFDKPEWVSGFCGSSTSASDTVLGNVYISVGTSIEEGVTTFGLGLSRGRKGKKGDLFTSTSSEVEEVIAGFAEFVTVEQLTGGHR